MSAPAIPMVEIRKAEALAKFPDDARGDAAMSVGAARLRPGADGDWGSIGNKMVKIDLVMLVYLRYLR